MAWLRLTLECQEQYVEAISGLFEQFAALAISSAAVSDEAKFAGVGDDPVYWQRTAVAALFEDSIDVDILLACARNRIGSDKLLRSKIESVADANWVDAHKAEHGQMVFADRLCIRPSWVAAGTDYPATLVLDPGLAFGSGRHQTTSLCLHWLARADLRDRHIIDYGCGSGILGLAAARLGAASVLGIDIDPQAIQASTDNARNNNLQDRVSFADSADDNMHTADVLIANILLNPLLQLAPHFAALLGENGKLLLSGILAVQVEECLAAYSPWFKMQAPVFEDEWALLEGTRMHNTLCIT